MNAIDRIGGGAPDVPDPRKKNEVKKPKEVPEQNLEAKGVIPVVNNPVDKTKSKTRLKATDAVKGGIPSTGQFSQEDKSKAGEEAYKKAAEDEEEVHESDEEQ